MELLSDTSVFSLLVISFITILLVKFFTFARKQWTYWRNNNVPYLKTQSIFSPVWKFVFRRITFPEYSEFLYYNHPDAKYIGTMDFDQPNLLIRDPELIRDITVKRFEHFTDHKKLVEDGAEPMFSKNVFWLRGDRWREMRNILSPSFTASKMRFMFDSMSKCSREFVDYLYDHPECCSSIDAKEMFTRYTNDVIANVGFGVSVNSMKDPDNEFLRHGKGVVDKIFCHVGKLILARLCPRLFTILGLRIVPPATARFFHNVVSETLKTRDEQNIVRPDMLHLLMQAKEKEKSTNHRMTVDDIVSQVFVFFLAGYDSSSNLICFMLYELAANPDVQEKLRDEVDRILEEGDGKISYEALSKMEYMDMVIAETLRMHPSVVLSDRVCTRTYEFPPAAPGYSGATLYPGEIAWIPVYSLHHDPKYFPEPANFDPERFSERNKRNIVPYTYLPFGAGPRKCLGERFASMEIKILMVYLLHKFMVKHTEKMQLPFEYSKKSFILVPAGGFWIGLERRSS